ncbi:MAG: S-methyl-5-thioribose-1-phosphate isomerase [Candidatus Margulisiibacteriota bacterium]|jgi:methylthioribose-1-phosphate isomerase
MKIETFRLKSKTILTIDQTRLPEKLVYVELDSSKTVYTAIKDMIVRGAPAIGIAAAFGMALAARELARNSLSSHKYYLAQLAKSGNFLKSSRPTAVNLAWAVDRMFNVAKSEPKAKVIAALLWEEAVAIWREDIALNESIGKHGAKLIRSGMSILTHCNAGALATGGHGTALGVIRTAWAEKKKLQVFADETRPRLQGARLTVWELQQEKIPVTLITDNMAGYLMQQNKIDLIVVGADRITQNGDVANKIGTYSVAVLAKYHKVPFYVAAPYSTIDPSLKTGKGIPIEEREKGEVLQIGKSFIASPKTDVYNPAFDVTPAELVTGIITEAGIFRYPYKF